MPKTLKEYTKNEGQKAYKFLTQAKVKEIKGEGTFELVASTEGEDREGESILATGWQTENFMKNPVILLGHDYHSLPIGAATEVFVEGDKLMVRGVFANTDEGQKARKLYDDGILRACSVGFIPVTRDGSVITSAELLEVSFVPVPCNPNAGNFAKSVSKKMIEDLVTSLKMIIPFDDNAILAAEDMVWDETAALENVKAWSDDGEEEDPEEEPTEDDTAEGDDEMDIEEEAEGNDESDDDEEIEDYENDDGEEEEKGIDFDMYQEAFAYVDEDNMEDESGYKLIHHDVNENDELVVVWLGVMDAMAKLLAEGNAGIPEEEVQGVYNHLVKHYEQFGKEAPELKSYTKFEIDQMFGKADEENDDKVDEEAKEVVDSIMKRFISDVQSLAASAELQLADVMGEIKRGAKSKGQHGQKAGRTLSAKTRTAIKNAADSCSKAAKDLSALLKATESPEQEAGKDTAELLLVARTIDKCAETLIKGLK